MARQAMLEKEEAGYVRLAVGGGTSSRSGGNHSWSRSNKHNVSGEQKDQCGLTQGTVWLPMDRQGYKQQRGRLQGGTAPTAQVLCSTEELALCSSSNWNTQDIISQKVI